MRKIGLAIVGLIISVSVIATAANQTSTETAKQQTIPESETAVAIFAGGCFWCMEHPFDETEGVISTTSGYTGGKELNPTYKQVAYGKTGHTESVKVVYDPKKVSYEKLLKIYWPNVDPTTNDRQFCDPGRQYRPAIFYLNEEQKRLALESEAQINETKTFKEPLLVEITQASTFYPAEGYHQDYYLKNPLRYKYYRAACRRDSRLEELWGKS